MTKDDKVVAGVLITGVLIGGGVYLYNRNQKNKLINEIMELGKNIPNFDASPEVLKTRTLSELKQIKLAIELELPKSIQIQGSPSFTDPRTYFDPRPTDATPQQF